MLYSALITCGAVTYPSVNIINSHALPIFTTDARSFKCSQALKRTCICGKIRINHRENFFVCFLDIYIIQDSALWFYNMVKIFDGVSNYTMNPLGVNA